MILRGLAATTSAKAAPGATPLNKAPVEAPLMPAKVEMEPGELPSSPTTPAAEESTPVLASSKGEVVDSTPPRNPGKIPARGASHDP